MHCKSSGKTDIGLVRKLNEDYIKIDEANRLFIVCDGMGGHNAGEVASKSAAEVTSSLYRNYYNDLLKDEILRLPRLFPPSTDVLTKAVRIANHNIFKKAESDPALSGMGTTIVAVAFEEDIATILHVGDSRIYRYYEEHLTPMTIDHSWAAELEKNENISAEEAAKLVNRNVITRALGVRESVDIDVATRKIVEGECYILCSDGLCGYVRDDDIRRVVADAKGDVSQICDLLIELANDRGGQDNVSVVAVKITGRGEESSLPQLETVKIDGEPAEYFAAEEEWAAKAESSNTKTVEIINPKSSKGSKGGLFIVILIIMVALIYYFFLRN